MHAKRRRVSAESISAFDTVSEAKPSFGNMACSGEGNDWGFRWRPESNSGLPSWLKRRHKSVTDAYGVVSGPVLLSNPGDPAPIMWTGGWRGVSVTVPFAAENERDAMLWRISEPGRPPTEFRSGKKPHGWFYHIGLPWLFGVTAFPSELVMFLADRSADALRDAYELANEPLKTVMLQFQPEGGICVQPAMVIGGRPKLPKSGRGEKRVQQYEAAVCRHRAVCGVFVSCGCDRPGSLQCVTHSRLVEDTINDEIGGSKYSRVKLLSSLDGITMLTTWVTSGSSFKWSSRSKSDPVTGFWKGQKRIFEWTILG